MSSPPPPPPPPPRADSLVLLGVVVGRRNRSKRLAFFDLDVAGAGRGGGAFDAAEARSRVAAVVASASVDAPPPSYSASPPPPPLPSRVEIIAKTRACGGGFEDDDALSRACKLRGECGALWDACCAATRRVTELRLGSKLDALGSGHTKMSRMQDTRPWKADAAGPASSSHDARGGGGARPPHQC